MRALFATLPLPGHFNPLVPVAQAVQEQGHTVAFVSAPAYRNRIERLGFEMLNAGLDWSEPDIAAVVAQAMERNSDTFFVSRLFAETVAKRALADMLRTVDLWRPDVIVRESTEFASLAAGESRDVPWATVCFGHERSPTKWAEALDGRLEPLRKMASLSSDPSLESIDRYLNLVFAPPGYQPPDQPLLPRSHVIRPITYEGPDSSLPDWTRDLPEQPTINGTLGTAFNHTPGLFESMIEAVRGQPWNLILTIGRNRDPSDFGSLPNNVGVAQFIPQSPLLERCDGLIAHAGYGTTMAGISSGVPMVLIPLGADQPAHATSCSRLGVAEVVPFEETSPIALREALAEILGDPVRCARATALRASLNELPDVRTAAELLDQLARTKQPIPRK